MSTHQFTSEDKSTLLTKIKVPTNQIRDVNCSRRDSPATHVLTIHRKAFDATYYHLHEDNTITVRVQKPFEDHYCKMDESNLAHGHEIAIAHIKALLSDNT